MDQKNDRKQSEQPRSVEAPPPRKRFRIEKIEERVAPKKGGYHNGSISGSIDTTSSSSGSY
jgi:hypothetical protein